jgi:hypothetical protein
MENLKIKIHITKDVLKRSAMCGINTGAINENCAIAIAVKDLFPQAKVYRHNIGYFGEKYNHRLPEHGQGRFINKFDSLTPSARIAAPEFSFELEVPEYVINSIGIQEALDIIEKSETLTLV